MKTLVAGSERAGWRLNTWRNLNSDLFWLQIEREESGLGEEASARRSGGLEGGREGGRLESTRVIICSKRYPYCTFKGCVDFGICVLTPEYLVKL